MRTDADEHGLADLLFGRIALREAYLNRNQLDLALRAQQAYAGRGERRSLGDVCREQGFLPRRAVEEIMARQEAELASEREALFGTLAVRNAFVTEEDVRRAVARQARAADGRPIGLLLRDQGLLTEQEHGALLTAQRRLLKARYEQGDELEAVWERPGGRPASRWLGGYFVIALVARGSMGVIYRAFDPRADREVALKVLPRESSVLPERRERFLAEARIMGRFRHRGLRPVHHVGTSEGVHFFTTDYIEGRTLEELRKAGGLEPRRAARICAAAARALHHVHERGVVHRDLKPANILVAGDDEPTLTDFGLARVLDAPFPAEPPGTTVGTLEYMAPEQAGASADAGPASDLYALGAVLFDAVAGEPPLGSARPKEMLRRIREQAPPPLRSLRPDAPRLLEDLCHACLAKDPSVRPASAAELAQGLESL